MRPPSPPPWLADLPPLHQHCPKQLHGQPCPAACRWIDGKPTFEINLPRLRILALHRRCWCCGYPLTTPGYVIVTESDITDRHGPLHTQGSPPLHRSCGLYAAAVCPYLRYSKSRRRVTGDDQRGTLTMHAFNRCAVIFPDDPNVFLTFGHYEPVETIRITSLEQVAGLYEQAVTNDTATEFTATPRMYWTASADDLQRLNADWMKAWDTLMALRTRNVNIDGHSYRGGLLKGCDQR